MKFEYRKNKNGTVDVMYKSNDITINLHGTAQEVETAYNNMRNSYIGDDIPVYSELIQYKFKYYEYEIPDAAEEPEESDDEHIKTYREDFEEKFPNAYVDISLCVNKIYYNNDGCRCPGISCKECWNRDMGT